jgi:hypothetical protein
MTLHTPDRKFRVYCGPFAMAAVTGLQSPLWKQRWPKRCNAWTQPCDCDRGA